MKYMITRVSQVVACMMVVFISLNCFAQPYSESKPPVMPDIRLSPGEVATNGATIEQICVRGYASTIRNVSEKTKREVFIRYFGHVPKNTGQFEIDHIISCELNGSQSVNNLWPEPYDTGLIYNAHTKDALENKLAAMVRKDLIENGHDHATQLLHQVQKEIATNWIDAYKKYVGKGQASKVTE